MKRIAFALIALLLFAGCTKKELVESCDWTWTELNGKNGYKVSSKSSPENWIFLPVAGVMYNDKLDVAGIRGYYRSSTLSLPSLAWVLYIYNDDHKMDGSSFGRFYGYSIRPVIK
ncbi:MAG: hypothetical protein J5835_00635 [Bacteroidales bacterium]|nr:hypothetical protein [Bacteroidales bacterium]